MKMQSIYSCAYVKTPYASQDKLAKITTVATILCVAPLTLCFIH